MRDQKVIYLMGAGRSGTTALSIFMGAAETIINLGELHQLPDHVNGKKKCSCGEALNKCGFWRDQRDELTLFSSDEYQNKSNKLEKHSAIIKYFFSNPLGNDKRIYKEANEILLAHIGERKYAVLDASKYIGRALGLSKITGLDVYYIYLVRDPRGVVDSFGKGVQTSRGMFNAAIYYLLVNLTAEIVCLTLLRHKVVKLKYEDLLESPASLIEKIGAHFDIDISVVTDNIQKNREFDVGHLIGGNRLVSNETIKFRKAVGWKHRMPRYKQLLVYLLTLPISLINKYRP